MEKRRFAAGILTAAAALSLSGCGGMFDTEYVVTNDYVPTAQTNAGPADAVSVSTFSQLKRAILDLVSRGETEGRLTFDQAYEGDITADMASACWEVRTQDALCAYCVENIAYDLTQIVTYYEATVYISYSDRVPAPEEIVHMQYTTGVGDVIKTAVEQGQSRLAVLISRSSTSAAGMEQLVSQTYRENPGIAPREPAASVNLFSGTGTQRLYEINLRYGMTAQERLSRKEEMDALDPFAQLDTAGLGQAGKALAACEYLTGSCTYDREGQYNDIYSALIRGQSGSEGMALAYVDLCGRLGLDCQIIYGQRDWQDSCWNLVKVDGDYYHVDPSMCAENGLEEAFLLRDEDMWGSYRWDTAAYPACQGELRYWNMAGQASEGED